MRSGVGACSSLELTTCGGLDSGLLLLAVAGINGQPVFLRVTLGSFTPFGAHQLAGVVPSGLAGLEVDFVSIGFTQPGELGLSTERTVSFQ
jgi:hypothetical protein